MRGDPRRLLGGWATDTLTELERRELLRAALGDQELFDSLLEEEGLRELLADAAARQEVLAALERPSRWERLRAWLARPATVADLAMVAAALVVVLVGYRVFRAPDGTRGPAAARPAAVALSPAAVARLAQLPPRDTGAAGIEIEGFPVGTRPRMRSGAQFTVRVSVRAPARVVLVDRRPDGSAAQVWPPAGRAPASASPTATDRPAQLRFPLIASPPAGPHLLRLVVAPSELDLGALTPAGIDDAAPRLTLLDLPYEVALP